MMTGRTRILILLVFSLLGLWYSPSAEAVAAAQVRNRNRVNVAQILSRQQNDSSTPMARITVSGPAASRDRVMADAPQPEEDFVIQRAPRLMAEPKPVSQDLSQQSEEPAPTLQTQQHAPQFLPRPSLDLDSVKKLRRILGMDFLPDWMSIDDPDRHNLASDTGMPMGYPKPNPGLWSSLDQLNFTRPHFDVSMVNSLKQWLLEKASCPIEFLWEDLGPNFWPQHIRHGVCKSGSSCSWPLGMSCRQSGSRTLKILRWVCLNKSEAERNLMAMGGMLGAGAGLEEDYSGRRRIRRQTFTRKRRGGETDERRSLFRQRKIIRMLSKTSNDSMMMCHWTPQDHVVSDECTCACS